MVLQNYQNLIEMTSNIIDIIAFGVGFKCPRKIHLNTQWGGGAIDPLVPRFRGATERWWWHNQMNIYAWALLKREGHMF